MSAMRAEEIIDEDDWIEIEKASRTQATAAEVSVRVTVAAIGRGAKVPKARAYLAFRGKAAEWIVANGPRFRVAIGGDKANYIRIVPDPQGGKFEFGESARGNGATKRMNLDALSVWPNEDRAPTAAEWDITPDRMRLRLPNDFAKAKSSPTHVSNVVSALARR